MSLPPPTLCVAPMMALTDRHARYFLRLLSRHTWLYTEMVTSAALLHGDVPRLLHHHPRERPLVLQVGGSEPPAMAACARLGAEYGYDEININVGCPSERVRAGAFGACLMAEPATIAACVAAMTGSVPVPVTVKTRIGIDERDSYAELCDFVGTVAAAGCKTFIVHARKAWLRGLSPKENRSVPPLRHDVVYTLKRDFPALRIILNGGVRSLDEAAVHLAAVDGVMIGREAYANPYLLAAADARLYGDEGPAPSRHHIVEAMLPYVEAELSAGTRLLSITRHLLGLYQGQPGARAWRRILSEDAARPGAGIEVILAALQRVR